MELRNPAKENTLLMDFAARSIFPDATRDSLETTGDKGLVNGLVIEKQKGLIAKVFGHFRAGTEPSLSSDDADRMLYELEDLNRLRQLGIDTPEVVRVEAEFFVMKLMSHTKVNWKLLTKLLERLHGATAQSVVCSSPSRPAAFGFARDSFYGLRRITNGWSNDWWTFFIGTRFSPSIDMLERRLPDIALSGVDVSRSMAIVRFARWLADDVLLRSSPCHPWFPPPLSGSLLHGDVFANNVLHDGSRTMLIDPVCFYGDPLLDLVKYSNKRGDNEPAGLVYKFYYAFDLFAWTRNSMHLASVEIAMQKLVRYMASTRTAPPSCLGARHLVIVRRKGEAREKEMEGQTRSEVVLVCFGAFNPPHPNHLRLLDIARGALMLNDDDLPTLSVRGFYIPAPDAYLSSAAKDTSPSQRLPLDLRERLILQGQDRWDVCTYLSDHATTLTTLQIMMGGKIYLVAGSDTYQKALEPERLRIPASTNVILVERSSSDARINWEDVESTIRTRETKYQGAGSVLCVRQEETEVWSSTKIRKSPLLWSQFTAELARNEEKK